MIDLQQIKDPTFLKTLSDKELVLLAETIRSFLLESIQKTGGHLSSNLGVVELTIALHRVFESPNDAIIFDVGHQVYTHKILTGRAAGFESLRQTNGLSGYSNYQESVHDLWESGHAGTSLSALMGHIKAKTLTGTKGHSIAVIGDAAITNGTAFEALNLIGSDQSLPALIVLNDNQMSISKSVGAFSKALTTLRTSPLFMSSKRFFSRFLPGFILNFISHFKRAIRVFFQRMNMFEDLGFLYIGPIDGHDLKAMTRTFERAKRTKRPVVIHVITEKGKGHKEAAYDEIGTYHGISRNASYDDHMITWSEGIQLLLKDFQEVKMTYVIMPAMTVGTKFLDFAKTFPDRFLDVGIAEEHAAVMASMMSRTGIPVFLPLYSTFLQRATDQILNDIARSDTHVVIGIDRAGIAGEDGSTHNGLYDLSLLSAMPNVVITMPYDLLEANVLLHDAFLRQTHPFVIRYPKGLISSIAKGIPLDTTPHRPTWTVIEDGTDVCLIGYGPSIDLLKEVKALGLKDSMIVNARYIKPFDAVMFDEICKNGMTIVVHEEACGHGLLGHMLLEHMANKGYKNDIILINLGDDIVDHGEPEDLRARHGIDAASVFKFLKGMI
ncbi:MAG: 1-deoxy-D-xylulose-5-phosphate synthase [Acholeplasmataceae bacterium]|nr:1-deoxy-D-xylulose-5-phosphate synthase [Acholeplasmataceae bacterium]